MSMTATEIRCQASAISTRAHARRSAATAPHPDAALLARLRAGDETAFAELVRRESRKLLAVGRRILRSDEEAQEAVQDALRSAFQNLDGFEGSARISTWLHRITVNAALMRLRSMKRRRKDSIEELLPGFAEEGQHLAPVTSLRHGAEDEIASAQVAAIVRAAIDELPENYRVVLVLRDIEGLDTAETAAALGIGPDAAKMRLHRARQALRTVLAERLSQEAPPLSRNGALPGPRWRRGSQSSGAVDASEEAVRDASDVLVFSTCRTARWSGRRPSSTASSSTSSGAASRRPTSQ